MGRKIFALVFGLTLVIGCIGTSSLYSSIGKFVIMLDLVQHDNGDTPTTNIGFFLSGIGDGRHECITITGLAEELSNDMYRSHGVPKNADAACHAFWAGMGETVYLVQNKGNVEVYKREEYEEGGASKYKKVKTVKVY
jgi:hypothetical protein